MAGPTETLNRLSSLDDDGTMTGEEWRTITLEDIERRGLERSNMGWPGGDSSKLSASEFLTYRVGVQGLCGSRVRGKPPFRLTTRGASGGGGGESSRSLPLLGDVRILRRELILRSEPMSRRRLEDMLLHGESALRLGQVDPLWCGYEPNSSRSGALFSLSQWACGDGSTLNLSV